MAAFRKINRYVWIALLGIIASFAINQANLNILRNHEDADVLLREHQTISTADDASYLRPAQNYLAGEGWKTADAGRQSYFLRTPGYGLIWFFMLTTFGANALTALKIFQVLLFGLSVYLLGRSMQLLQIPEKIILPAILFYSISPFFQGFLFYTLTEGVSPQLTVFFVFLLLKAHCESKPGTAFRFILLAALLLGFMIILRPALGIWLPALFFILWRKIKTLHRLKLQTLTIVFLLALMPLLSWQLRNFIITGTYTGLHPVYFPEQTGVFRPTHKAAWSFFKGWGTTGEQFHSIMVPFWEANIDGRPDTAETENIIRQIPMEFYDRNQEKIQETLTYFRNAIINQREYYEQGKPMPMQTHPEETRAIENFRELTRAYRTHDPLRYYLLAPVDVLGEMILHSNLSLYMFQHTFRGKPAMEALRLLMAAFHILLFAGIIFLIFSRKPLYLKMLLAYTPLLWILYLAFIQRGIEERYMLPFLPVMLVGLVLLLRPHKEAP